MRGVRGDLFAYSTWLRHATISLEERGLLEGSEAGTPYSVLSNKGSCLSARVVELASFKKIADYAHINLQPAKPGTYESIAKQTKAVENEPAPKTKKKNRRDVSASSLSFRPTACVLPGLISGEDSFELGGRRRCGL